MKILILLLVIIALTFAQTDADQAEGLLQSLHLDAQNNLKDLNETWEVNGGLLQENVDTWQQSFTSQTEECESRDQIQIDAQSDFEENGNKIDWISVTIKQKLAQTEKLYQDRCTANRNYINGLKNDKLLVKLITFLRDSLNQKESMTLIQKRQFAQTLMQFIALYKNKDTKQLMKMHIQLSQDQEQDYVDDEAYDVENPFDVSERTDEQVGEGHVDDNREQIEVEEFTSSGNRSFSDYKSELIGILDSLEAEVRKKMALSQEDEVSAGIAAAEFRARIEKELQELDAELYIQVSSTTKLERRLQEVSSKAVRCRQTLEAIQSSYEDAQSVYAEAFSKYSLKVSEINEEIEVFGYVLGLYQSNVSGEEYREQLDDYTSDGQYDNTYGDRQIDQIDFINEDN